MCPAWSRFQQAQDSSAQTERGHQGRKWHGDAFDSDCWLWKLPEVGRKQWHMLAQNRSVRCKTRGITGDFGHSFTLLSKWQTSVTVAAA